MTKKQRIIAAVMIFWAILLIIMPLYSIYRGPITISPYVRYIVTIWPSDNGEGNVGWAYIYDNKTDTYYSFLHYAHISGNAKEPVKNKFVYEFKDITYTFHFDDFDHPAVTFPLNDKQHTIYDDGNNILIKQTPKFLPFPEEVVAPLPNADCFYSPIELRDLSNTYAILLMDPLQNGTDEISVYTDVQEQWTQVPFVLPDGTIENQFTGYARRHFNPEAGYEGWNDSCDPYIGDLELCQTNADGTATLYDVTYSDGQLLLTESKQYENGVPPDWKF